MTINSLLLVSDSAMNEGVAILLIGWVVVMLTLVVLAVIFWSISKVLTINLKKARLKIGRSAENAETAFNTPADVNAAIATALYLFFEEQHDTESGVITVKKVSKTYTPWSSKLHGFNNNLTGR